MELIENKVAKSGLITIDLQAFEPKKEIVSFDLKDYLFMEMILKEKDFREDLKKLDWSQFENKIIAVHCSVDAIIAHWAYMLIVAHAAPLGAKVYFGKADEVRFQLMNQAVENHDWSAYQSKRVLIKGCSDSELHPSLYLKATSNLINVADRIMYGEACSFVPVYRAPKGSKR